MKKIANKLIYSKHIMQNILELEPGWFPTYHDV